jgi:peptide/nickel transport system substrate-binding protein
MRFPKTAAAGLTAFAVAFSATFAVAQDAGAVEIAPDGPLPSVAREDTLIVGWSITSPIGVTNPWAVPGYTHQEGNNLMWEPLSYFGIFTDSEIPWLASSMEYTSDDFTSMRIELNPAARWSDGVPVTSADVVFTFEGQMNNNSLPYNAAFVQFVESVTAVDDLTVDVEFKIPAPRFKFDVLTLKFDTGIPIVPAHALSAVEDVNSFVGGTEIPHSGPFALIAWNANQKIYDLREDWWAAEAGLIDMPDVKRVVFANIGGTVGQSMDTIAQRIVNSEMDSALDMRSAVIGNILAQNENITTHSGSESPFGYLDWWPNSLWMNTQLAPYDDPQLRRAMALTINRDLIDMFLYDGAPISTIFPFPLYPGLEAFAESDAVQALIAQYDPRRFDLEESAAIMESIGYERNRNGMWEKDGETINATIHGFEGIHSDIVPLLVEMLLNGGFDAAINFGTDAYQQMADGAPGLYMFGHGASLKDPYAAFELFHGRFSDPLGVTAGSNRFSRYSNPEYDAILDAMAPLASDDPEFLALAAQAMEIYWRDTIDIPIIQWLHRIPYNQTYWTNWPTVENPSLGMNGAFWAHTGMLVVTSLQKAE